MKSKSVQSFHPLPGRQTGVIQTIYDIVKAHAGVPITIGIKVETLSADSSMRKVVKTEAAALGGKEEEGSVFSTQMPIA